MKIFKIFAVLFMLFSFAGFLPAENDSDSSADEAKPFFDFGVGPFTGVNPLLPIEEEGFVDVANTVAMFHIKMGAVKDLTTYKFSYNWRVEGSPSNSLLIGEINSGYWFSDNVYISIGAGFISKGFSYADEYYNPNNKYKARILGSLYLNIKLASFKIKPLAPEVRTEVWVEAGARTVGFPIFCVVVRFTPSGN
ncbi:hypothetical protein KY348_01880 [Candidatus Woesearchaeota archaeon]|nr:hypothetical protein [Candidatus Woesearchaeota archaeon]